MDSLEQSIHDKLVSLLPDHLAVLGEGALKMFVEFAKAQNRGRTPAQTRAALLVTLERLVQFATDADCVFVRRVNTDNSLELLDVEPWWKPGQAPVGTIPKLKQPGEGISGWAVTHSSGHPVVIRDVHDSIENAAAYGAHKMTSVRGSEAEQQFIAFIGSEACIPLVVEGRPVAVIVAVRGELYTPEQKTQVQTRLERWGEILTPLYALASIIDDVHDHEERLNEIVRLWPRVALEPNDDLFFRKVITVLTCDKGLSWHRAMVFLFRDPYPASAVCVMAVGGNGAVEWSEVQSRLSGEFKSLEKYLEASQEPEFGFQDFLYTLVQTTVGVVRPEVVAQNEWLEASFNGTAPTPAVAEGVLPLDADDPLIAELRAGAFADAFSERAAESGHWVVPLVQPVPADVALTGRPCRPIGFVLLDRPYAHRRDLPTQLPLTRLVCDLFAGLLATRFPNGYFAVRSPAQPAAPAGYSAS